MRLYIGSTRQFIEDTVHNQIADRLKAAFFNYYRYTPSPSEIKSWRQSLASISQVFQHNNLLDHGIILEYQIPFTSKRLDCLIAGRDAHRKDNAVIIELKQWEKCSPADGENEVITYVGGANREVLHPSAQVGQYANYLQDVHTAFYEPPKPVALSACAYLHNYRFVSDEVLLTEKFAQTLERYPLFSMDDVAPLSDFLKTRLEGGAGLEVLGRIEDGKYRPSKKLMDHVGNVIKGKLRQGIHEMGFADEVFWTQAGFGWGCVKNEGNHVYQENRRQAPATPCHRPVEVTIRGSFGTE